MSMPVNAERAICLWLLYRVLVRLIAISSYGCASGCLPVSGVWYIGRTLYTSCSSCIASSWSHSPGSWCSSAHYTFESEQNLLREPLQPGIGSFLVKRFLKCGICFFIYLTCLWRQLLACRPVSRNDFRKQSMPRLAKFCLERLEVVLSWYVLQKVSTKSASSESFYQISFRAFEGGKPALIDLLVVDAIQNKSVGFETILKLLFQALFCSISRSL